MLFGHLRAEEFMTVIEGGTLPPRRRTHLSACASCETRLHSIEIIHKDLATNSDIPEPDWHDFRESVRLELLSRSIQRQSAFRRWTGGPARPAMAWALSFVFLIGVTTGGMLWHNSRDTATVVFPEVEVPEISATTDIDSELAAWGSIGIFEEISNLDAPQAELLTELLQSAQEGSPERQ